MSFITNLTTHITNRFKQPTSGSSRREFSTSSIAEFWCSISNIGFFIVGLYFGDITLLLAATFSLVSHSIPNQGIHDLDILGVLLIGAKVLLNLSVILASPAVLVFGVVAIMVNILDTILTPRFYHLIGPWIHVAWHLTAAAAMFVLNAGLIGLPLSFAAISIAQMLPAIVIASSIVAACIYVIPKISTRFYPNSVNQTTAHQQNDSKSQVEANDSMQQETKPSTELDTAPAPIMVKNLWSRGEMGQLTHRAPFCSYTPKKFCC
jgi:hypothetical protein